MRLKTLEWWLFYVNVTYDYYPLHSTDEMRCIAVVVASIMSLIKKCWGNRIVILFWKNLF